MPVDPGPTPKPPDPPKGLVSVVVYPFKYIGYVHKLIKWNKKNV
jgi:hypothetical protein